VNAPDITAALLGVLRSSDLPLLATEIAGRLREAGHENADKKVVNHLLQRQGAAAVHARTGHPGGRRPAAGRRAGGGMVLK